MSNASKASVPTVPAQSAGAAQDAHVLREERHYYALNARVYRWFSRYYDFVCRPIAGLRRRVARLIPVDPSSRVLDVATGTGAQALAFAPRAREVVGIDLSEAMLRVARRKNHLANLAFIAGDATALPFSAQSFDLTCISFALHEMPATIRERTLREMIRVTRPGGQIVVVDYALPRGVVARWLVFHLVKLYERDHYAEFVRSDLGALLRRLGLAPSAEHSALLGAARIIVASIPEPTT